MPLRLPEPGTFEAALVPILVPVGELVRLSLSPNTEPYWGKRAANRFDAPKDLPPADRFGVCYAADSLETAFAETVIHDGSVYSDGLYVVARSDIVRRHRVSFMRPGRADLRFVDLAGDALKNLGLNNDLCSGDDYTLPQRWAQAIYHHALDWDGIRYVSRQRNTHHAYAVFERSGVERDGASLITDLEIERLCSQFRVAQIYPG